MNNPKDVHVVDQALAAFKMLGRGLAEVYLELVENGVPPEHACCVIVEIAAVQFSSSFHPKTDGDDS